MFEEMKILCEKHNLTGIGVTYLLRHPANATVYIHYPDEPRCSFGDGLTFQAAFEQALANKPLDIERSWPKPQ